MTDTINRNENDEYVVISKAKLTAAIAHVFSNFLIKQTTREVLNGHNGVDESPEIEDILKFVQQENYAHIVKHTKLISWAFHLLSFQDLITLQLFPNIKEMTESFAALKAVQNSLKKIWHLVPKDTNAQVVVVGDGNKPRTAATIAFNTPFICHSVDPAMKDYILPDSIMRVIPYGDRIENVQIRGEKNQLGIIVSVHSHAPLNFIGKSVIFDKYLIINIPCCVRLDPMDSVELRSRSLGQYSYMEHGIWSPKNLVNIFWTKD